MQHRQHVAFALPADNEAANEHKKAYGNDTTSVNVAIDGGVEKISPNRTLRRKMRVALSIWGTPGRRDHEPVSAPPVRLRTAEPGVERNESC
jgi:hypothetical protein